MKNNPTIFEAITTIPNLYVFYTYRQKEFRSAIPIIKNGIADFFEYIKNPDNDRWYMDRLIDYKLNIQYPEKYTFERILECVDRIADDCQSILTHGNRLTKYLKYNLEQFLELKDRIGAWTNIIEPVSAELERDFGGLDEPEAKSILKALNGLQTAAKTIEALFAKADRCLHIIGAIDNRENYSWNPSAYRPGHEEVEKLYHVSLYCNEIMEKGFQAEKPEHMIGVGNFGFQKEISFTHDQSVAQSILRAFRDIWMIVHGRLKVPELLSWIEHDGISHRQLKDMMGGFYKDDMTKFIPKDLKQTITLYRYWLTLQKSRIDPLIVNMDNLVEGMKTVDYKSIGILVCDVKLTGKEEYMHGEKEFRVLPEQILSIKRLI